MSTVGVISGIATDVCLFMAGPSAPATLLLSLCTVCPVADASFKQKDRPKAVSLQALIGLVMIRLR
jgi:hypothetical protein